MYQGPTKYRPINQSNSEIRKKRLKDQKTVMAAILVAFTILLFLFFVLLINLSVSSAKHKKELEGNHIDPVGSNSSSLEEQPSSDNTPPASSEKETDPILPSGDITYKFKDYSENAMHLGPLVLIDDAHPYTFKDATGVIDFRDLRIKGSKGTAIYGLAKYSMFLRQDAINAMNSFIGDFYKKYEDDQYLTVLVAYRTYEEQAKSYENYPEDSPKPGCSDYHSGYAFKIGPNNTINGASNIYAQFGIEQAPNAYKYGIINRYPSNKIDITGDFEDHYRYVGVPHSYIMKEMDFCLEQYLDYLRMHTVNDEHVKFDIEGVGSYDIYYVPASDTGVTKVPVPDGDYEYSVSGDNVGGFVVTIKLK